MFNVEKELELNEDKISVVINFVDNIRSKSNDNGYNNYYYEIIKMLDPQEESAFNTYLLIAIETIETGKYGETDIHIFKTLFSKIIELEKTFLDNFYQQLNSIENRNEKLLYQLEYLKKFPININEKDFAYINSIVQYILNTMQNFVKDRATDIFNKSFFDNGYSKFVCAITPIKRLATKQEIDLYDDFHDLKAVVEAFDFINRICVKDIIEIIRQNQNSNLAPELFRDIIKNCYRQKWYIDEKILQISIEFFIDYLTAYDDMVIKTDNYLELKTPIINSREEYDSIYRTKSLKLSYYADKILQQGFLTFSEMSFLSCVMNNEYEKNCLFELLVRKIHYVLDDDKPLLKDRIINQKIYIDQYNYFLEKNRVA
jgi:hypothetical protein